jgi:predicted transcriptional regulator
MSKGDEILKNKIRRMIFNLVATYPGVSFNNLKNIFELTDSNLRYHLNYLEKNNKISTDMEQGVRCYYPHPASVTIPQNSEPTLETQKLNLPQERILNIIIRYPGINQKELISRSKMNRLKVIRNLNALRNLNLIINTKDQNNVYYEYVPDVEMKYSILKGVVIKFLKDEIDEETFLRLKRRLE